MGRNTETVVVLSAHSDDFVIGAGGTIAKYRKEGKKVTAIVFSLGERSHPWLKEKVVQKMRAAETKKATRVLRCGVVLFDLKDTEILADYRRSGAEQRLVQLLQRKKPTKIFTHSSEDPHPDHRAVHTITLEVLEKLSFHPEVYIYSVWNPVSFKTQFPRLYVDVSSTFGTKLKSLQQFPSQRFNAIYPLSLLIFYRAIKDAWRIGTRFAESFYRIR